MVSIKGMIKELNEVIEKYPKVKEFYLIRAKLYTKICEFGKAIEDYERVTDNYLCHTVSSVYKKYNLTKEVEKYYKKAIKDNKNNYKNYTSRAYFYMDIGEKEKALKDCNTALKLCPKNKLIIESIENLITKINQTKPNRA